MTATLDLDKVRRGDAIKFRYRNLKDQDGNALTLSDYDIRCALKLANDESATDSSALAVITDGSGITVSGASITKAMFPASATASLAHGTKLKADVQLTLSSDATDVFTPLEVLAEIEADVTIDSP